MKVVIACGGTGGHLFPGLAVGEALLGRGHDVLLLISEKEIDRKAVEGRACFQIRRLPAMGWPRGVSLQTLKFFRQLIQARFFCRRLYRQFVPDIVLAMGGFTSAAPLWEARRLRVPAVIHEANAIAGRANRLLARKAERVVLGFGQAASYFSGANIVVGGTPIRAELKQKLDRALVKLELGFESGKPLILVMGGSQGARGINALIMEALAYLKQEQEQKQSGLQWAHLTGKGEEERVHAAYEKAGQFCRVWPFYGEMQKLYSIADLVISRAGASSIAETNYFGLPAIYIPYPFAADGHQSANARIQVEAGAALCFEESQITGPVLAETIKKLTADPEKLRTMASNSRRLSVDDAAEKLADLLCELGQKLR